MRIGLGLGVSLLFLAGTMPAQQRAGVESDSLCAQVLRSRHLPGATCRTLAAAIVTAATEHLYRPDPREVQHTAPRASAAGTPAQTDAVPGIQPLAVSGATIAAASTDSGSRAVVAISVNPAVLFVSPGDADAMAAASRISDLTLVLPAGDLDRDHDGKVDYVGTRLRLNVTGARAGREVGQAGRALLQAVEAEAGLVNAVLEALRRSANPSACATALLAPAPSAATITRRCGGEVSLEADPDLYREVRARIARARQEADARYLGLDLRADFGDPTLSGSVPGGAFALTAGLAMGRRIVPLRQDGTSAGLRARAGIRHLHLPAPGPTATAFDGAIGFELFRPLDDENGLNLSAGVDFRYGGGRGDEARLVTNYTAFRFGLSVPIAGGSGVAVGVTLPMDGDVSPALTVNFNWSLLLPQR